MPKPKHIAIIAGEESGDIHASVLIRQMKKNHPQVRISGIGGKHMKEAGAEVIFDLAKYGVTGVTEVLRLFKVLNKAFTTIKHHLREEKPDLLILVDYPGFNLRLAQFAKKQLNIKIIYYISPQIWAWKAKRIHKIKKYVDKMAVIFPFEKPIYEQAGVPVRFVGHPLVDKITKKNLSSKLELGLPLNKKIIALLPGSRRNEIERHMPVLYQTAGLLAEKSSDYHFVVPIAQVQHTNQIMTYFTNTKTPVTYVQGKAIDCMSAADFVIVASGTASLESALLEKPMCIIYKSSFLTYIAAIAFIKVRFLGLCNLLADKMIVPEFLQYDCNPIELAQYILSFDKNKYQTQYMIARLSALKETLSSNKADCSLFDLIEKELL